MAMPRFYITWYRSNDSLGRWPGTSGEFIISADTAQEAVNTINSRQKEIWGDDFHIRAVFSFDEVKGLDLNAM